MALSHENTNTTTNAIYRMYAQRNAKQAKRGYLGWSQIGKPCNRALWMSFRWAKQDSIDGRMARLFDTGHREEERVINDLRAIGCTVYAIDPNTGKQYGVSDHGGHFRGHLDLVALGLPEDPKTFTLVDVKTIKSKKFDQLLKDGMEKMYPEYAAQAHGYMGHQGLTQAMFIFVCKDDDRIHCELFAYDKAVFEKYSARALAIIQSQEPPQRISNDPSWYECKWCDYSAMCHGSAVPAPTCRSCAHATPEMDGDARWSCAKHKADLLFGNQLLGCESHVYIPALIGFAQVVDATDEHVVYEVNGRFFKNGTPPACYSSKEIHACQDKALLVEESKFINDMRQQFGAEIVG